MKIICLQENLIKGLQTVSHLAGKNVNLPILNNVLINAENGQIALTTTNLEIGIDCKIRGKVERNGKCTVQARLLTDFVSLLPRDNILLELKDNKLKIECANNKTSINVLSPEDFPLLPKVAKKNEYYIKTADLKNSLVKVAFSVAIDTTRPEISGVFLSINNKKATMVGTDSYRLSEKGVDLERSSSDNNIIIPIETIQEVIRIIDDSYEDNVKFYLDENQVLFSVDNVEIVSRLTEGTYPDYKQIIPKDSKTKIDVDINELIQAIKRTSLFCKYGINDVKLNFIPDKDEIIVTANSDQLGENIATIKAGIHGEKNEITFNYRYLLDGLSNLDGDTALLEINDSSSPGLIRSKKDSDYIYIIMPIKQ